MYPFKELILIIINLNSGSKKNNDSILEKNILPLFKEDYDHHIIYTTKITNYLSEYVKKNKLHLVNIKKCIILGGDGTIFDYIQFISKTDAYDIFYHIPISIIPCGSGNAIAKNLGINNIQEGLDCIFNDDYQYLRLNKIIHNQNVYKTLLGVSSGLIASIDIGTEHLRSLNSYRFYYGISKSIVKINTFSATLEMIPYLNNPDNNKCSVSGSFSMFYATQLPWISNDFIISPETQLNNDYIDIIYIVNHQLSIKQRLQLFYYFQQGTHLENLDFITIKRVKSYYLQFNLEPKPEYLTIDGESITINDINCLTSDEQLKFSIKI